MNERIIRRCVCQKSLEQLFFLGGVLCKILGELPAAVFKMDRPDQKNAGGFVGETCCLNIKKSAFSGV